MARASAARREEDRITEVRERIKTLTPREAEVFALVVTGMLNKQIAFDLGVSEKMVKVHRGRVMEKMRAGSLAELVRLADEGGVISAKSLIARAPGLGARRRRDGTKVHYRAERPTVTISSSAVMSSFPPCP